MDESSMNQFAAFMQVIGFNLKRLLGNHGFTSYGLKG